MSQLKKIYAKSVDKDGHKTTLIQHLREVTVQMCEFISIYEKELKSIDKNINLIRVLIYAAFFHDLGKVHPGFQKQLIDEKAWGYRHEVLSLAFVRYLDIPKCELPYLLSGIALHHKDLAFILDKYYYNSHILNDCVYRVPSYDLSNPIANLEVLSKGISQDIINELEIFIKGDFLLKFIKKYSFSFEVYKLNEEFKLSPEKIPVEIFNSIKTIEENSNFFIKKGGRGSRSLSKHENILKGMIARGFVLSADHLASAKGVYNLSKGINKIDDLINIFPILQNPRPHQKRISEKEGNAILIAPTGSGKTESALLWSIYQKQLNNTNGRTFIILPYRASMNAMKIRLSEKFGEKEVSLVHGKSLVKAYNELMEQGYTKKESLHSSREKETLARMNTSPLRISSPYAIFKPFFGNKGYEANLVSMLNSTLIFDEIHAYDTKITGFTLASAKYISNMFNAKVLFMSATMPKHLQDILIENFDTGEIIKPDEDFLKKNIRHKLKLLNNSPFECIDNIIYDAKDNKSVLVIVNTVDKSIELYNKIRENYDNVFLLHSRFTAYDREEKEKIITPENGKILIATQVVEVSLDIDYYTCYTEIAPFESLLQRFGRVNRHAEREPAIVNVCCSNKEDDPVYNIEYLKRTFETLTEMNNKVISEWEVQNLLDKSYPERLKKELQEKVKENMNEFTVSFINTLTPYGLKDNKVMQDLQKKWNELFDGYEIIPKSVYIEKNAKKNLNSLEISQYMISVSRRRYYSMKNNNLIEKDDDFLIIYDDTNNPYNSNTGLCF